MNLKVRIAVIILGGWLAQSVIVPFVSFGRAQPDIILITISVLGFFAGPTVGATGGFAAGLLHDLLVADSVGLWVLVMTVVGYLSGQVERTILGRSALMPMLAIGLVSIVGQVFFMALSFLLGQPIEFLATIRSAVLPSAGYTAIVGSLLFPYLSGLLGAERKATVFK